MASHSPLPCGSLFLRRLYGLVHFVDSVDKAVLFLPQFIHDIVLKESHDMVTCLSVHMFNLYILQCGNSAGGSLKVNGFGIKSTI